MQNHFWQLIAVKTFYMVPNPSSPSLSGKVERQVSWSRKYIVQWADGSHQEQQVHHLYGSLTRKRPLRIGDHVIALADSSESSWHHSINHYIIVCPPLCIHTYRLASPSSYENIFLTRWACESTLYVRIYSCNHSYCAEVGVCMPGTVVRTKQGKIIVEFCDGQK